MWIERRLTDASGFPRPAFYVAGKRYWAVADLEAWVKTLPCSPPDWLNFAGDKAAKREPA
jgi:hypothetical protein